jgi:hypothetical protein
MRVSAIDHMGRNYKFQVLYLVSLREQRTVFLSLSCTEVVPKEKMIGGCSHTIRLIGTPQAQPGVIIG